MKVHLIIIIKSEIWPITHCLGFSHETMVCAVCTSLFLLMCGMSWLLRESFMSWWFLLRILTSVTCIQYITRTRYPTDEWRLVQNVFSIIFFRGRVSDMWYHHMLSIHNVDLGKLVYYPYILCSIWCLSIAGYIMTLRPYSLVAILLHFIIIMFVEFSKEF